MKQNALISVLLVLSGAIFEYSAAQIGGLAPPVRTGQGSSSQGTRSGVQPSAIRPAMQLNNVTEIQAGTFSITDPRPLEVAATLLSRKLGIPVAYEEAAWVASSDVIRAGDYPGNEGVRSKTNPRGPLIPRGGTVIVVLPTTKEGLVVAKPADLILATLEHHRLSRNPGDFRLETFGEGEFGIVADRAGDASGRLVKQVSPFDLKISFPEEERTQAQTIELILQSIRAVGKVGVFPLFVLRGSFQTNLVRVGAEGETAREVLSRTLRIKGQNKLSWTLRFDPEGGNYAFSLVAVEAEVPGVGGVGLQSIVWPK